MSQALRRRNNRHERGTAGVKPSMRRGATTVVARTTVGTSREIAERFANHFAGYTPAQLAQHAKVTKEAARLWLGAERCINLKDALELAHSLPEGKYWLQSEIGEFDSPQLIAKLLGALQRGGQ